MVKLVQTQTNVAASGAGREWLVAGPQDFAEITPLGRGAFGKVLFVKHKGTGQHYALKCQVSCGGDETPSMASA